MVCVFGCNENTSQTKSHFDHDHVVPHHWPNDLADLSFKLRTRIEAKTVDGGTLAEINDLVSWTAEVAADTDLSEADWTPLYHATEGLAIESRSSGGTLSAEHRRQLQSLCELIDRAAAKVRQQQTNPPEVS